jgi:hypothetical protein
MSAAVLVDNSRHEWSKDLKSQPGPRRGLDFEDIQKLGQTETNKVVRVYGDRPERP